MAYCPKCGRENLDDTKFCAYCGANLSSAIKAVEYKQSGESSRVKQRSESKSELIIIVLVAMAVIAVIVAAVSFILLVGETARDVIKDEGTCRYDYSFRTTQNIGYYEAEEGYKFVIATLRIQNNATINVSTSALNWELVSEGKVYYYNYVTYEEEINYTAVDVTKGGDSTTEIVYEIPSTSTGYKLRPTGVLSPKMVIDDTLLP